jgi:hypothetical protein
LTKFLLDHGASPNEQLSRCPFYSPFNIKNFQNLIWTPWTLFLLGSIAVVDKSTCSRELPELLEIFLRKDADASICLFGYQMKNIKERVVWVGLFT